MKGYIFLMIIGLAHHLLSVHGHLHTHDWRAMSGQAGFARHSFPHGVPLFHHQYPSVFPAHSLTNAMEQRGTASLSENHKLNCFNQLSTVGAAHSTTSPEGSPVLTQHPLNMSPPLTNTANSENNVDAGFESDSISVTGSPHSLSVLNEDDDERSSLPLSNTANEGTSIEKHSNLRKNDFLTGFATQFPTAHAFNPTLAAQLFLQSPLLPQPSQWLYTQLYGHYNDFPWFRNTNTNCNSLTSVQPLTGTMSADISSSGTNTTEVASNGVNLIKRCVTLISHPHPHPNTHPEDEAHQQVEDNTHACGSPPVTSSQSSPPPSSAYNIDLDEVGAMKSHTEKNSIGPIRSRTPKPMDVWRPY